MAAPRRPTPPERCARSHAIVHSFDGIARRAEPAQVLVLFAITATAMLAVIGLLYSFGLVLNQRRATQTAVDAASLSATWQVIAELQSDNRRDSVIRDAVVQYALSNGVPSDSSPTDATYIQAVYVDASGAALSPSVAVGSGGSFPSNARGVRVTASSNVATVLPRFVGLSQILVRDSGTASAAPTATPASATPVLPIAVSFTDVASALTQGTLYDLFASSHFVNGQPPTLDLSSANAPKRGPTLAGWMQYWSDGQDEAGWQLGTNTNVTLAGGTYFENIASGLHDNVRRQALTDASNAAYGIVIVPVYDTATSTSLHIAGFAQMKVLDANITSTSTRGLFVPYVASPGATTTTFSGTDIGSAVVKLVS